MGELNSSAATITAFRNRVPDFIVAQRQLDIASPNQDETYWYFDKATQYYGYYLGVSNIFNAANALATWSTKKGWISKNPMHTVQLRHVVGTGKDTFTKLIWNHLIVKLVVGDSFMEVKRSDNEEELIVNMIPISPERVRVVFNKTGMIKRYDVWDGGKWREVKKENMLHSTNKRIADQLHGTSQIEPAEKDVLRIEEALSDEQIIKHRDKALGIVYYETDNTGKISYINSQIEEAVAKGEMVGLPKGTAEIQPYPSRSSEDRTDWIAFLENRFYQNFGVPRSIASSDGTSEVGGKMGHVIFEPIYTAEQLDLEEDLWSQLQIEVKFNRPPSLGGLVQEEEAKNTGQTNIQPNDSIVNLNRE